ncbi:glycosyltransferase [Tianweitania sp. BSSL-BM11]|uniref:Glycosyltransferase n=1 Tax=Tianweitania aestuarii TaxID=2814886 RepID=A0ABS5RQV1_9HYPH|nr:glycosyltransferase family 4 protein [Tianweitania aestuarii]MBS9719421.1 glycosyltransferase [Tianweitania aestuarii]
MHLVFVTSLVPDGTLTTGYEIANAAIIDGLRRAGVKVSVVGFTWPGKQPIDPDNTVLLGSVDVQTHTASAKQRLLWLGRAIVEGHTFSSVKLRKAGEARVRQALQKLEPFDGYVLNGVTLAGAYPELFRNKPSIFVAHNVEHQSATENAAAARSLVERLLYTREARLLKQLEAKLCGQADFVFTLAEDDRAPLGIADDRLSATLPLTTRKTAPAPLPSRQPTYDLALIGTWTWQPNRIGLDWFLQRVVPHLPDDMTVKIAGHAPPGLRSDHPGVQFVGRVKDATDFVRGAKVIPLISQAGSGVQLKTIETFELGMPAVATRSSLRGIADVPENCTVADDPAAFALALTHATRLRLPEGDGRGFHAAQMTAMDRQILRGLAALSFALRRQAA